jgi:hypothetical protein
MSVIDDITVQDFKDLFYRNFNYLPTWSVDTVYNVGDVAFYDITQKFYTCIEDGTEGVVPTNTSNWELNPYLIKTDYVWDEDIEKAYDESKATVLTKINTEAALKQAFLYLSAHYLVGDINAGGLQSTGAGLLSSKAVGNVSAGYVVPEWAKKEGYSFYTTTYYGMKYLALTRPYRIGNVIPFSTPRHALNPINYNNL